MSWKIMRVGSQRLQLLFYLLATRVQYRSKSCIEARSAITSAGCQVNEAMLSISLEPGTTLPKGPSQFYTRYNKITGHRLPLQNHTAALAFLLHLSLNLETTTPGIFAPQESPR
jgi:hypothetical protein